MWLPDSFGKEELIACISQAALEDPFEGMTVKGVPSYTLSQGRICWANGKLDVVEGAGRYIDRPPFPVSYEAVEKINQAKKPRAVVRSAA